MRYVKNDVENQETKQIGTVKTLFSILAQRCSEMKQAVNQLKLFQVAATLEKQEKNEYLEIDEADYQWLKKCLMASDFSGIYVGKLVADFDDPVNVKPDCMKVN